MRGLFSSFAYLLALLASALMALQPAAAQSILRDAETEQLLTDITAPLIEASELEPGNVELVLINDSSINAFVAGGQAVYVHSGLINEAETANEVQGVIAHELGHITAGHVVRFNERTKAANGITILSLLLSAGGRGRCRDGRDHGGAAGCARQFPGLQPRSGSHHRSGRRTLSFGRGNFGPGDDQIFRAPAR